MTADLAASVCDLCFPCGQWNIAPSLFFLFCEWICVGMCGRVGVTVVFKRRRPEQDDSARVPGHSLRDIESSC